MAPSFNAMASVGFQKLPITLLRLRLISTPPHFMQRNKEPPKKGKKRMRKAVSKGKAKKPRRWLMARRIRPKDIAALIATLVTTVAGLLSSVMELKREWNASKTRNKTKPKPRKPKRKKSLKAPTPKRLHNKKPEQKHETKTETKREQ